jgi:hypothetical protein
VLVHVATIIYRAKAIADDDYNDNDDAKATAAIYSTTTDPDKDPYNTTTWL